MSVTTIANQVIFTITSPPATESRIVDRGPRRTFPGQVIRWRTEDANPVEIGNASEIRLMFFDILREQVMETAYLPPGWDSRNAGPMSAEAIQNAIRLLDSLESARISPETVIPTCDDSILIRYALFNQTIEWEFFSAGDNVRAQIEPGGETSYVEVAAAEISQYV